MYVYAVRLGFFTAPTFFNSPVCPLEDLLVSNVSWNETAVIQNGVGVYSFSGGNVTYNGVSLGSTATYRTTMNYRCSGSQVHRNVSRVCESICENGTWTPQVMIESAGNGFACTPYITIYHII